MHFKVKNSIFFPWRFQGLALFIIFIQLCRTKGSILTRSKEVELGGTVILRCTLTSPHQDIVQVTWQKNINGNFNNMATFQEGKEPNLLDPYKDRINFTILSVNDTAITFWNVSTQDHGCYRCIFNTFPQIENGNPCLSVYDNVSVRTHYEISDVDFNATCSATGFPRPNISWIAPEGEKNEEEFTNFNGTIFVKGSIHLKISRRQTSQDVICKVTHRGKEISIKIVEVGRSYLVPVILSVSAVVLVVGVIIGVYCCKRHKKKRTGY